MGKFFFILLAIGAILAILKYLGMLIGRIFMWAIAAFFIVGGIMFILALLNVIDGNTGWIITFIATFIGAGYSLYEFFGNSSEIVSEVNQDYKKSNLREIYDKNGNEIDCYEGYKCCGNCYYNNQRSDKQFHSVWCDKYIHINAIQTNLCDHWRHFRH